MMIIHRNAVIWWQRKLEIVLNLMNSFSCEKDHPLFKTIDSIPPPGGTCPQAISCGRKCQLTGSRGPVNGLNTESKRIFAHIYSHQCNLLPPKIWPPTGNRLLARALVRSWGAWLSPGSIQIIGPWEILMWFWKCNFQSCLLIGIFKFIMIMSSDVHRTLLMISQYWFR